MKRLWAWYLRPSRLERRMGPLFILIESWLLCFALGFAVAMAIVQQGWYHP